MCKLFYFDCETTGTKHWRNGIHQVSGCIEIDGKIKEDFDYKVKPNPSCTIEDEALAVGNVTREQIDSYPEMKEIHSQICSLLGKYVDKFKKTDKFFLVGYNNASFDNQFFRAFFVQCGRPAGKVASVNEPAGVITTVGGQTLIQPEFLLKYNSTSKNGKHIPPSVDEPCPVISTQVRLGLVQPEFIVQRNSGEPNSKLVDVDGPARTITGTGGNQELVQPKFLTHYYGQGGQLSSIENPAPTIPTKARTALISPEFLTIYNGKSLHRSVEEPSPVIATNDRFGLVQPEFFIDKHYGKSQNQSIDEPAGTILPTDKHRLVEVEPFIMPTNYHNKPKSIEEPLQTITANRKHHYIVNPSHGGHSTSIDAPCPVIIARQDKAPLYFVQVETGSIAIAVFDYDSQICIKIKQFMAVYGLVDIKMRMLRVLELLKIQGFPAEYKLEGNQSDQKKFIGNSVHPLVVKFWTEALATKIIYTENKKVA